ncbi:hypothetical protein KAW18_14250, partial [candidate division WOR-3 bacterium]|nr:hypothetical protein [candidate division WOR-3 bacterium]
MQATYVSSNQFRISTDKTSEFLAGRRIRANCGSNYKYSTIQSSVYSDPNTTVTIEESILTSNLTEVHYGIVNIGEQGSFPNHSHNGDEGTGGELSLLTLSDTPSLYEEREYLRATTSGVEWTIPEAETVVVRVKEENISAITKGQVCAVVTGSSGVKAEVGLCDCDDSNKIRILGLAQDNIPQNEDGIVAYKGVLTNVDTRTTNSGVNPNGETWASMDLLWATNIPGGMTNVRPTNGRSIKAARTVKGNSATDSLIIISLENPIWNTAAAGEDVVLRVGDSVGVNKVSIRNYDNDEVADFDSYGNLTVSGTVDNVDVAVFKSDFDSHDHDNRYYTESEIDTISGTLQTDIDGKPDTEVFLTEGIPSNSIGKEGDIAVDQNVGTIYEKSTVDPAPDSDIFYPAVSGDDGHWLPGDFYNTLTQMYFGMFLEGIGTFIRCPNITIPQGSTITEAYVKFTAYSSLSSTVVNVNVYFNDVDDAIAPTSSSEGNALSLTSAIAWNSVTSWIDGVKYNSPSLISILQNVVNRTGWSSGNALQVVIKDNGSSGSYKYRSASTVDYLSGSEKAELHIAWTEPPGTIAWVKKLSPDFLKLSDTPTTYSGSADKYLKTTISGIEFVEDLYTKSEVDTISGSLQTSIDSMPVTFLELEDTPATYSGSEGEYIKTTSSGVEFSQIALLDLSDTPTTYSGVSGKYLKTTNSGI